MVEQRAMPPEVKICSRIADARRSRPSTCVTLAQVILEPNASSVRATDRIQFLSVSLVAFTAGIGFDAVFRRMLQEAEKVPVSLTNGSQS